MSNFTTEVRFICEVAAGYDEQQERDKVHDIITAAMPKVFDFDFPIFDEAYRPVLERKILMHYYTREISYETVALWKLHLEARLNEIMPYYNRLYEVELINYNPIWDVDLTEDKIQTIGTETSNNENRTGAEQSTDTTQVYGHSEGGSTSNDQSLYSDTPQGYITDLADGKYLTNATIDSGGTTNHNDNNSTTTSNGGVQNTRNTLTTGSLDTTDQYLKHIRGKRGSLTYSKMLDEEVALRDKIGNIDYRIIRDLKDLFFTLWE